MDQTILFAGILFVASAVVAVVSFLRIKKKTQPQLITASLQKPKDGFAAPLKKLFLGSDKTLKDILPALEELLLSADVGVTMTAKLLGQLSEQKLASTVDAIDFIKSECEKLLTVPSPVDFSTAHPYVIFCVGINGTGKTTSIGKLAYQLKQTGKKVLVVGADTFRAAAGDQLKVWAERAGVEFVGGEPNSDPASVVHNGLSAAKSRKVDVVLVDTAGRLHTKTSLMEELKKMQRVAVKVLGVEPNEFWLVLDATTGQNGLTQARVFTEALHLTGLILSKYDGTAKGGIILAIAQDLKLPVRYLGVGEGVDDLKLFEAKAFVADLFDS